MSHSFPEMISHGFQEVMSERQVPFARSSCNVNDILIQNIHTRNLSLSYNKLVVDLCFVRHKVLLNCKLEHTNLRFASANMKFTVKNSPSCPPQHKKIYST